MVWIVKLEELQEGKIVSRRKVITIDRPTVINPADDIGHGLEDANALLSSLQQTLVSSQFVTMPGIVVFVINEESLSAAVEQHP